MLRGPDGAERPLHSRHLVGRSRACELQLTDRTVSAEHAVLWWTGEAWRVRDLGSRNGTWLDGQRLQPLLDQPLAQGTELRFGLAEQGYALTSDGPPVAFALDEAEVRVIGTPSLLALPSPADPQVSLVRTAMGWRVDGSDEPLPPAPVLVAGGSTFRAILPDPVAPTLPAGQLADTFPEHGLKFVVSRDEEHVEMWLVAPEGGEVALGARSHAETLLLLARARLADRAQGLPEDEQGWVHMEDVTRGLRITENALNVHVFRARQQLAEAGLPEAHRVIERRLRSFQLRIGLARFEVIRS
jgi:hypothetical protein